MPQIKWEDYLNDFKSWVHGRSNPSKWRSRKRRRLRRRIAGEDWLHSATTSGIRRARKVVVLVAGTTVIVLGIALILTPVPALLVIPAGIGILGIEYAWARRLLKRVRAEIEYYTKKSKKD